MRILLYILCVVLICLGAGCSKLPEPTPTVYKIDSGLKNYLDVFLKEAKDRNVKIDTTNLILRFVAEAEFNGTDYCGQCFQANKKPELYQKEIKITKNETCWGSTQAFTKEALVFHELGHCLLNRTAHRTDLLKNNVPASIMNTNNFDLYNACLYVIDDDPKKCNFTARRKYYIDELFNEKTERPSWEN